MKKIIVLVLLVFSANYLGAQTQRDSMRAAMLAIWEDVSKSDSIRAVSFYTFINTGFIYNNPDTVFEMGEELVRFAEETQYPNYKDLIAETRNIQAASFHFVANYPKAIEYYEHCMEIRNELGDIPKIARPLSNIGYTYFIQGYNVLALEYNQRSLKINEEYGQKSGAAINLINIGLVYAEQDDYAEALSYYERSLAINEEIDKKQEIVNCLTNIGLVYAAENKYEKALDYYLRSLKIGEEIGEKYRVAVSLNNIGRIYADQANYEEAMDYYQQSLVIREEIGDKNGIAASLGNIALVYIDQEKYTDAINNCLKSLEISESIGLLGQQKEACACLHEAYKGAAKSSKALFYHERMVVLKDSINSQETSKELLQMEFLNEIFADSVATAEQTRLVEEGHQEEVRQKNQTRNIFAGVGLLALLLAGAFFGRWRYVQRSRTLIEKEKDRSDNLLLNILPADIAEELKEKGRADAREFKMASILFTDFKGFTAASEKLSAQELVAEINTCFKAFDGIMGKYDIEKIKTIGDAYMAAGGIPNPSESSVKNTILAALEMQTFIANRHAELTQLGLPCFEMRAGIHTGSVVAGIVGVKKFAYDIWGDTVNTASRMESSGAIGKVNISKATYKHLQNDPDFVFESRGKIQAKGKGEIEMWFVGLQG